MHFSTIFSHKKPSGFLLQKPRGFDTLSSLQALTQNLAGVLDRSLSGSRNYRVSGFAMIRRFIHSASRISKKRLHCVDCFSIAMCFLLFISHTGGFLNKSLYLRRCRRPCDIESAANFVNCAVKSIPFGIALEIVLCRHVTTPHFKVDALNTLFGSFAINSSVLVPPDNFSCEITPRSTA